MDRQSKLSSFKDNLPRTIAAFIVCYIFRYTSFLNILEYKQKKTTP